jgi:hypothetical protein
MKEADLYPPLKCYLESQGYTVKAEIGACDLVARRGDEPPVVVEMKLTFSLALVMQGIARQALVDVVYLAVPMSGAKGWSLRYRDIIALCRRLGLGLLAVDATAGQVTAHLDPGPYAPRKSKTGTARLLREFDRRVGDPNVGGTARQPQMTAYRQDALRCLAHLAAWGTDRPARIARATGVIRASSLLRADHYGWFDRVAHGTYGPSAKGRLALIDHGGALPDLIRPAQDHLTDAPAAP